MWLRWTYSCLGSIRRGGSACILRYGEQKRMLQGGTARTTNNRMEVTGSDRRTACADQACEVEVVADSGYLRRGMTEFPQRWRSNGWKAASGNPVLNQDLWWELAELAGYHRVTWIHAGGHSGHADQERRDAGVLGRRGKVDRIRRRSAEHGYRILIYRQRGLAIEWCRLNGS